MMLPTDLVQVAPTEARPFTKPEVDRLVDDINGIVYLLQHVQQHNPERLPDLYYHAGPLIDALLIVTGANPQPEWWIWPASRDGAQ